MFLFNVCFSILIFLGFCHGYFVMRVYDNDLECKSSRVQCLTNTSFTTCINSNNLTILGPIVFCPVGYYCNDSTQIPCTAITTTSITATIATSTTPLLITTTTQETNTTPESTSTPTTIITQATMTTKATTPALTTTTVTTTNTTPAASTTTTAAPTTSSSTFTNSTTASTTNGTTTVTLTTKQKVARPTGAPQCTAEGYYAAPACSQYYQCVKYTYLIFITYYTAELKNCIEGDYFDIGLSKCVLAALSDCEE